MEKTVMQELYDELLPYLKTSNGDIHILDLLTKIQEKYKPKEKQMIIKARSTAPLIDSPEKSEYVKEAENYYTTTFK